MYRSLIIAVTCALATPAFSQTAGQQIAGHLKQAKAAENAGDITKARAHYQKVLSLDPKNADARYAIGQLRITGPALAAKARETKFGSVMVPQYQLDDASLQDALTALGSFVEKESKEEVVPNFVVKDPDGKFADKTLTLNLKNAPAGAILKFVMEQAGAKVTYDEYAIVVAPR